MAEEISRTRSVRRITAPGDTGTYVDLKIIDSITFKEQKVPYQEWVLGFKNNPDDAARTVRVVEVGEDKLRVERIDSMDTVEETGIRQEALWSFLNADDPPVHLETHETTIYASDGNGNITDTGTWIKVQRVDSIEFTDVNDEVPGQEYVWKLDNPDKLDEDDDYKNLTQPVRTWDNSTINPPWRLDPFQTIVDCSMSPGYMLVIFNSGGVNKVAAIPMGELDSLGSTVYESRAIGWARGASQYYGVAQLKAASDLHVAATYLSIGTDGTVSDTDTLNYYNTKKTILGPSATSSTNAVTTKRPLINFTGRVFYDNLGNKTDFSTSTVTCTVERSWIIDPDAVAAVDKTGVLWGFSQAYATAGIHINYRKYYFADAHWDAINSLYVGPFGFSGGTAGPDQSNDFTIGNTATSAVTIPLNQRVMIYSNNGSVDDISLSVASGFYTVSQSSTDDYNTSYLGVSCTAYYVYSGSPVRTGPQYLYFDGSYELGTTAGNAVAWGQQNYVNSVYGPDIVYAANQTYEELYPDIGTYTFAANGKTSIKVIDATTLYFVNNNIVIKDGVDITSAIFSAIGAATTDWIHAIFLDVKKSDIDKLQ
jgi:hypothetical protein